jgi:Zn-dependent peptidase ImmA (M78 family)
MASGFKELPTETARRFMGIAPVDLDGMAEALGVIVQRYPLDEEVVGQIQRKGGNYVITINSLKRPHGQRYTLAHELAHFLLHRGFIEQGVVDSVMYRSNLSIELESQANGYATELLMPADLIRRCWRAGRRSFDEIAHEFDVSAEMARIRLKQLGYGAQQTG